MFQHANKKTLIRKQHGKMMLYLNRDNATEAVRVDPYSIKTVYDLIIFFFLKNWMHDPDDKLFLLKLLKKWIIQLLQI